jgi:hypothetical protein
MKSINEFLPVAFFIVDIMIFTVVIVGGLVSFILYTPFNVLVKTLFALFSILSIYQLFKNYVYVKWLLIKDSFAILLDVEEEKEEKN